MGYNLKKFFRNFGGLNLADSELLKDDTIATNLLNTKYGDNLSKIKRRGHKRQIRNRGGNGCITFLNRDTGISERLLIEDRIHRIVPQTLTLTYSGGLAPTVSFEIVDGTFKFILAEDGVEVLNFDVETLANTATAPLMSALKIAIDALPNFDVSAIPVDDFAYLLDIIPLQTFTATFPLTYNTTTLVPHRGTPQPFLAHWSRKDDDDFELTDHIQARGVLYLTDVDSGLWKYDGDLIQKVPNFTTVVPTEASSTGTEVYKYKTVFSFTDAQGNVTYSTPSPTLDVTGLAELNLTALDASTSVYNVDNATRLILRTVNGGNTFFVVAEIAASLLTFTDTVVDSVLINNEPYTLPDFTVVNGANYAYIDIFRDQIVMTGNNLNKDNVTFENVLSTESFFTLNGFQTESRDGGANTGIISLDNYLYVFKKNTIFLVTGELDTNKFQVDKLSDEGVGCLSNKSLIEFQRRVWFLGQKGIYSVNGTSLQLESRDISPLFQKEIRKVTTLRAFSLNWVEEDVLLINLPEKISGNRFSNLSRTLSYHSKTGKWSIWNNHNFANGADNFDFKIFYASDFVALNSDTEFQINLSSHTNTKLDYADNQSPIDWQYASNWETYGEPSVPKKYVRIKLYSLDTPLQNFDETAFSITVETQHDYVYTIESSAVISFDDDSEGWGIDAWGEFPWGHERDRTARTRLKAKKARSIRTLLSNNTLYENVLLSGYEYEVAVEHDTYMRRG